MVSEKLLSSENFVDYDIPMKQSNMNLHSNGHLEFYNGQAKPKPQQRCANFLFFYLIQPSPYLPRKFLLVVAAYAVIIVEYNLQP